MDKEIPRRISSLNKKAWLSMRYLFVKYFFLEIVFFYDWYILEKEKKRIKNTKSCSTVILLNLYNTVAWWIL